MPQLVMTAAPGSAQLALEEFRRDSINGQQLTELAPGVWLVDCDEGFWGLAETWIDEPPIFVRHICPVDLAIPLIATRAYSEAVAHRSRAPQWRAKQSIPINKGLARLSDVAVAEYAERIDPDVSFSVQSRILIDLPYKPFDINQAISAALIDATGAALDVRQPFQILSVVCAAVPAASVSRPHCPPQPLAPDMQNAFLGLSLASHNISDWAGGVRRFRREKEQISRAEFKLLEALEAFHIELPSGGVALDLGAAPGGWTRVLRQTGQYVTAVDPAALHPSLATDRGVRHKRMTAETYLREGPDTFDLLVNDMRMNARASARLMNAFADFLYPHAEALMTLKLSQSDALLDRACAILQERYAILRRRQLFHNRSEATIHLKLKET